MTRANPQQKKQKEAVVEQLKKIPIIQIAVEKCGISRAIYYVWRKQDPEFAKAADQALSDGVLFINDLSEGQLISLIKDQDIQSIRFWLTHRHPAYAAKLQVEANINGIEEPLSTEQQRFVERAVKQFSLRPKADKKKG